MKVEDLNKVIEILEQNNSEEHAYFEFFYDDFPDYESIRANKEGIIAYSKSLLSSIKQFELKEKQYQEGEKDNFIEFHTGNWYVNKEFSLPYIKPIFVKRKEIVKPKPTKTTLKGKIITVLLVLLLIVIVFLTLLGFIEVLNWIF